jgi:hypothetical protein
VIESNPSATFSLIFRITNLQNLLASRLKIPWRPIKPRPLDLQGPIFVSSSPSQASVMQRRLDGAVSEKKNSFPVHNLRSDDHHKSIIYASSATQSSRIPSFLKPRPHATEGPWLLLPPHPSKEKKAAFAFGGDLLFKKFYEACILIVFRAQRLQPLMH